MNNLCYILCLLLVLYNSEIFSQPENDNICNTTPLLTVGTLGSSPNCGGTFPYDNIGAGPQAGEPSGSCWDSVDPQTVWFSFEAPAIGAVYISTNFPGGTLGDTQIALYEGDPSCPDDNFAGLSQIGCSEDVSNNFLSMISTTLVTPGEIYYIKFSGFGEVGTFCLEVVEDTPCNDNSLCEAGEDICICTDCGDLCSNAQATFIDYTSPMAASTIPIVYCESEISATSNSLVPAVYIPISPVSSNMDDLSCVIWNLSSTQGSFYSSTDTIVPIDSIKHGSTFFLKMTDAEIDTAIMATGGMTTITFIAANTADTTDQCMFTHIVDWNNTIYQSDLMDWTNAASTQCCIAPMVTVGYDCDSSNIVVDVSNVGSSTAGTNFTIMTSTGATQMIEDTIIYSLEATDQSISYSLTISDGSSSCHLVFDSIYPDCRTLMTGCNNIMLDGGLDIMPSTNWTEVSNNTIIADWDTRLAGAGSASLGGQGSMTSSISQEVTIPTGTAMLYFWGILPSCDSMDDTISITVDNDTTVWMINGADDKCSSVTWQEYSVDLSFFADGAAHTIQIQVMEMGTNGGATSFFVDEIVLESCADEVGCEEVITIPGNIASGTYEANNSINSDGIIMGTAVFFQAGSEINLDPEFCVPADVEFCARIASCGTPAAKLVQAEKSKVVLNKKGNDSTPKISTEKKTQERFKE